LHIPWKKTRGKTETEMGRELLGVRVRREMSRGRRTVVEGCCCVEEEVEKEKEKGKGKEEEEEEGKKEKKQKGDEKEKEKKKK
jgi:hypothetical protein